MRFDLLIKGGQVLDPSAGFAGTLDVAISGSAIAAVEPDIPREAARRVVDAHRRLVVPGLIDLHTHVFHGRDYLGVDADSIAWRSGVTTWVDAGSVGAFSLPLFREAVVRRSQARILAFINISYLGIPGLNYDEYCNPAACDVDLLVRVVESARDLVVGVKTRMGREGVCYPGLEPLRRAVEAGGRIGLPVMCHISGSPPPIEEVLAMLRPGDIVTHAYTGSGERLVDGSGLHPAALEARERGILFDLGHGAGSFSFGSAEALAAVGFWPDTISTDLHQLSVPGPSLVADQELVVRVRGDGSPRFTLLTAMTKMLALGMPIEAVVTATTSRPAEILCRAGRIGTLRVGAQADVAVLELEHGPVTLVDVDGRERTAERSLRCVVTIVAGREMVQRPTPPPPPWVDLIER